MSGCGGRGRPRGRRRGRRGRGGETRRWRGAMQDDIAQGIDKKPAVELIATSRPVEPFVTQGAPTLPTGRRQGLQHGRPTPPNQPLLRNKEN